jgi:hypothetical protein
LRGRVECSGQKWLHGGWCVVVRIPTILYGMLLRTEHKVQVICNHDPSMSSYLPVIFGKTARSCLHSLWHDHHPWHNGYGCTETICVYVSMCVCLTY